MPYEFSIFFHLSSIYFSISRLKSVVSSRTLQMNFHARLRPYPYLAVQMFILIPALMLRSIEPLDYLLYFIIVEAGFYSLGGNETGR